VVNSIVTLAVVAGLGVTDISENGFALGWDYIKLPNPVFAGDTLYSESEVLEVRESKSRPGQGVVKVLTRGLKQDGTVVIEYARSVMVWRRADAPQLKHFPGHGGHGGTKCGPRCLCDFARGGPATRMTNLATMMPGRIGLLRQAVEQQARADAPEFACPRPRRRAASSAGRSRRCRPMKCPRYPLRISAARRAAWIPVMIVVGGSGRLSNIEVCRKAASSKSLR
jgi:hypothetical protein